MKTYPVNLLLEGRNALVVGGGKIAARKASGLIEAGANVTVVAPETNAAIERLAADKAISLKKREFRENDLDGMALVFAATSDKETNSRLLELCQRRGVLCCAVDASWRKGGFITPASFHKDGLSVAISTNGVSCQKAKWAKWSVAKALERREDATLLALGVDHYSLSLEHREKIVPSPEKKQAIAAKLADAAWIREFVPLVTCNRIELLALASLTDERVEFLKDTLGLNVFAEETVHVKTGFDAFARLAMVAAGLLSQIPGEKHVAAQVKAAFEEAFANGWGGPAMKAWLDAATRVSRDIRAKLEPGIHSFEIEDVAVEYIGSETDGLDGVNALVAGTGAVGLGMVERLQKKGASVMALYNSAPPEKPAISPLRGFRPLSELDVHLPENRVIVCAASVDKPLISKRHASLFPEDCDTLVVDLGVPRNADPELDTAADNLLLVNLDDLKHWRRRETLDLKQMERDARAVVENRKPLYDKIIGGI